MKLRNIKLFKGKKAKQGPVHTMNITMGHLIDVFRPKTFYDKYNYIGAVPWIEDGDIFKAMEPLIIFMDYKMRPKWCPKWFLRFLYLFGCDNSIIRVRNWKLYNLFSKITKGYRLMDYKTKWEWYDLRISVVGCDQVQDLAQMIESDFYRKGRRDDLIAAIRANEPEFNATYWSIDKLNEYLDNLLETCEKNN